ncbi:hypothetical protein ACFCP7_09205 [Paenibacillus elgii]
MEYKGYSIKPRNEGFGYEVVRNGINPMPGAVWFVNIERAQKGIDALIQSNGNTELYWVLVKQ